MGVCSRGVAGRSSKLAVRLSGALALAWAAITLAGCGSDAPEISVQVLTDLAPVSQFDEVVVLRRGQAHSFVVSSSQRFDAPRVVVEYRDVLAGTVLELAAELRFRGRTVLRRSRTTRVTGRHIVLFTFTASCTEISCPMSDPRATECEGGRCVVPDCSGASCGTPGCTTDGECVASSGCEAPRCVDGVCFQFADPARCAPMEICVPSRGCELRLPDPDAGIPDVPDAWTPEIDAAGDCIEGTQLACSTDCGTVGVAQCVLGSVGACTPPPEACNGIDDDCNGATDDGFTCSPGAREACTTSCGSEGTHDCESGCDWGPCVPSAAERCNGADEDCDGTIDEGFRASVHLSTYGSLATHSPGCDGFTERFGAFCNTAFHRECRALGCYTSGFGPGENDGDISNGTCVVGDVLEVPYTTLSSLIGPCDGVGETYSLGCNAAISRYCGMNGYTTGFGPVEFSGGIATITCLRNAEPRATTFTELASHFGACDGTTIRFGPHCNAAINRYCAANGFVSGFGPIENDGDIAWVACVRP
jgi:hypothetical protein